MQSNPENNPPARVPIVAATLFALPLALAAFESIFQPIGLDQGWFSRVADVIAAGGLPYRDAWEVKSPATHYTYAFSELVFGRSTRSIRVMDLLFLAGALFALYRIALRDGRLAAIVSGVLFASLHFRLGYWNAAQPDPWACMIGVMALSILAPSSADPNGASTQTSPPELESRSRTAYIGGFLIGLAALFKLPYAALGAPALFAVWRGRPLRTEVWACLWLALGAITPLLVCIGWFAWQGGLEAMLEIQLGFNREVHSAAISFGVATHLEAFGRILASPAIAVLLPFAVLGVLRLRRLRPQMLRVHLAWLLVAIVLLVLQARYYIYQQSVLYPPLVLLASAGLIESIDRLRAIVGQSQRPDWIVDSASAVLTVGLLAIALPPIETNAFETFALGRKDEAAHFRRFTGGGVWAPQPLYRLASELERRSRPEDTVFVWGLAPGVHYLAQRSAPSRFASSYPLIAGAAEGYRDRNRTEFLQAMHAAPPRFVVVATQDRNTLYPGTSWQHYLRFTELRVFVQERYEPAGEVAHFRIFERRDLRSTK